MEPQLQPLQTQTQTQPLAQLQTTQQPQQNIYKVRIKNIHKWVDNTDLAKTFSEQLNLTPVKVKIDMYGPKSLEKGWAEFKTAEEASQALKLTGFSIRDQTLQVIPFVDELPPPKKEKQIKKPNNNKPVPQATGDPAQTNQQNNNQTTQPQSKKPNNKNKDRIRAVNASQVALVSEQQDTTNSTTTQQPNQNNIPKTTNPKKKVKEIPVYEEEFERLRTKYKTFKIESTNPRIISLTLPPSDPDFPYDLEGLLLNITLPPSYPKEPCVLKVVNPDDEVTPRIKKNIEAAVLKRAQTAYLGKPMLAGILFWLDRNMEQVLVDKLTTDDFKLARMGIEVVVNATAKPPPMRQITTNPDQPPLVIAPPTTPAPTTPAPTTTPTSEDSSTTEPAEEQPPAPTPTITTALKGTRIKFEEVSLVNVGVSTCIFILSCEKCRNRFDVMNLIKGSQWTDVCEKCSNPCSVGLRPEIMHEYSNILGYLDVEGCALFDILPSSFKAACFECNGSVMFKDHQYSETKTEKNCMQCHQKIAIAISRPTFTKIKAKRATIIIDPAVLEAKKKRKNRDPNDLLIKPGQPLPNQGTCKHYKHSHRWLRFPCCGKAFPCDVCHEIQTNSEHEAKWANRMICGFCSREQTYSQKPCVACGGDTAGTTTTRFWEGGDGCRDKSKMSSKDAHKFKNSVLKTHSKKASRVGPKKE